MAAALGYKKLRALGPKTGRRTATAEMATQPRTQLMGDQEVGIKVPRDRNGEFKPQIAKKYEKR